MSVEDLSNTTSLATVADLPEANAEPVSDDTALGAVWDQLERDNGAARGTDGKFTNTNGEGGEALPIDPPQEGEGTGEEGDEAGSSTLTASGAPLPANWNGMDEDWAKIPADVQAKIATREGELHSRMSEQGRQIGTYKPVYDVVDQNRDLFNGKKRDDGGEITPAFAVQFLMEAQRQIDANPVASLIQIADRYGMRQHLAAALNGQVPIPQTPQQPAMSPAEIQRIVQEALTKNATVHSANEELSRFAAGKPLYAEISEDDMVHSIHKARNRLGDTASKQAVFDLAYDIAVNADPDLRAKAAATKKAAASDPKRVADAKRANGVNVTSTSTGKARELTEDELLGQAFDDIQNKD